MGLTVGSGGIEISKSGRILHCKAEIRSLKLDPAKRRALQQTTP